MDYLAIMIIGLLIASLLFIFDHYYREYYLDRTREELFTIRDQLFNYASDGKLDFNSKSYGLTRAKLNGMIRFTHELSMIRVIVLLISHSRYRKNDESYIEYVHKCDKAMDELTIEQKEVISHVTEEMHRRIVWYIFHSSLFMWISYHFINIILQLIHFFSKIDRVINIIVRNIKNWSSLDFEATLISNDMHASNC